MKNEIDEYAERPPVGIANGGSRAREKAPVGIASAIVGGIKIFPLGKAGVNACLKRSDRISFQISIFFQGKILGEGIEACHILIALTKCFAARINDYGRLIFEHRNVNMPRYS